jgi:hypothetical protein
LKVYALLNHIHSCLAIHGLASHPFGSWKGSTEFMWLRDGVPRDIPGIRCITYGYPAEIFDTQSFQRVPDMAVYLCFKLKSFVRYTVSRPLVILAHSLGGIVLQQALVRLAKDPKFGEAILNRIKAVILLGVPSKGMFISHLKSIVSGRPSEHLVGVLEPNSNFLSWLREEYTLAKSLDKIRVISAYETKRSQLIKVS